ncbi:hypothetical protein Trydic_g10902 [Trypoxylus dichotomus]
MIRKCEFQSSFGRICLANLLPKEQALRLDAFEYSLLLCIDVGTLGKSDMMTRCLIEDDYQYFEQLEVPLPLKTAAEAQWDLHKIYGNATLTFCSKTFEYAKLEALLDEDPSQTQQNLSSALEATSQAVFTRLHALEMIQKQET